MREEGLLSSLWLIIDVRRHGGTLGRIGWKLSAWLEVAVRQADEVVNNELLVLEFNRDLRGVHDVTCRSSEPIVIGFTQFEI